MLHNSRGGTERWAFLANPLGKVSFLVDIWIVLVPGLYLFLRNEINLYKHCGKRGVGRGEDDEGGKRANSKKGNENIWSPFQTLDGFVRENSHIFSYCKHAHLMSIAFWT